MQTFTLTVPLTGLADVLGGKHEGLGEQNLPEVLGQDWGPNAANGQSCPGNEHKVNQIRGRSSTSKIPNPKFQITDTKRVYTNCTNFHESEPGDFP